MTANSKSDTRGSIYYIGSVIALLIMFFFGKLVPVWGNVTQVGVSVIGVFIGLIFAVIITGDMLWPSLCALVALTINDYYASINVAIGSLFGAGVVYGFFLITALITGMNDAGTGDAIASILLTRKFFQRKPMLLSYMFLVIFSFAVNFMNAMGTLLLAFPILNSMLKEAGIGPEDDYSRFMKIGLFMAVNLGYTFKSAVMPDFAFRFEYFTTALEGTGISLDLLGYTLFEIITTMVFLLLYVLAMKYIFKCNFGKLVDTDFRKKPELVKSAKLDRYQCIYIVAFIIFAVSGLAPASWTVIKKIGQYGVLTLVVVAMTFLKRKDEVGNTVQMFDLGKYLRTVPWGIGIALGAFQQIGTAMSSDGAGIKQWLVSTIGVTMADSGSWILAIIAIIGSSIITQVFNNAATMTIFAALLAPLCTSYTIKGTMNPAVLLAAITLCCQSGWMTMASAGTAPLLYSQSGINSRFVFTKGLVMEGIFILTSLAVYFIFVLIA